MPSVNAARVFPAFDDRGTLNVGAPADIAVMELREGSFEFVDNYKGTRMAASACSRSTQFWPASEHRRGRKAEAKEVPSGSAPSGSAPRHHECQQPNRMSNPADGGHFCTRPDSPVAQATGWWSWSDSNQPPECYGMWGCPTSSPCRTPGIDSNLTLVRSWEAASTGEKGRSNRKRPVVVPSGEKKAAVVRGTPGLSMPA